MRKQVLVLVLFMLGIVNLSLAQKLNNKNQPQAWRNIDSLLNLGLVKSAEIEIDQLFSNAKINHIHTDYVKALFYKLKLDKNEQNPNDFIAELNHEITISKFPQTQILHSFLGDFYKQYYDNHRWQINQKTHISGVLSLDIKQWSKQNFLDNTQTHFLTSLQNKDSLYLIPIRDLGAVLMVDSSSYKYYPSLYDLLAKRAIQYFKQISKPRPLLKSNFSETNFLLPTHEFLKQEIKIDDIGDYKLQALKIYQSLSKIHQQNFDSIALVRAELNRLKFIKKNFHTASKYNENYLRILNDLALTHIQLEVSAEVYYEMAKLYANEGLKYDPFVKKEFRWKKKKAVEWAEKAVHLFPNSSGGKACAKLLEQIQNPAIEFSLREVNLPNQPILSSLTYKNINRIYFRLIKAHYFNEEINKQRRNNKEELNTYLTRKTYMNWSKELPNEGDFQSHNLQLRVPDLSNGFYILLSSPDPKFDVKSLIQINKFWVSNLSFIQRNDLKGSMDVFILGRKLGNPLNKVKFEIHKSDYNYQKRLQEWKLREVKYSGSSGYLRINDLEENQSYRFTLSLNEDTIVETRVVNQGRLMKPSNKESFRTQLFTDRSIYRPGQRVYFKGIVYQKLDDHFKVSPSYKTEIKFLDVNRKEINSARKISNGFGSFDGSFIIPKEILNGRMLLETKTGSVSIQVEAYKRPNFEILFEPLKGQYRINDEVKIKGKLQTFSGSNLTNAKGKFVISRTETPTYWSRNWIPSEELTIESGEIQSDEYGNFEISFLAQEKLESNRENYPIFNYKIHVEFSDLNGETQDEEKSIRIAFTDLKLKPEVPENIDQEGLGFIPISASNLNEIKQEVNVSVSVFKLKSPERIFRKRKWQQPDFFNTDRETFYTYFPNDQFNHESDVEDWGIDYQVFQAEINTGEVSGLELEDFKTWPSGKYKISFQSKDDLDEKVLVHRYFILYSSEDAQIPHPKIEFFVFDQNQIKLGDSLNFIIGSSKKNVRVFYEIQHQNQVILSKWIQLQNEKKKVKIPLSKKLKGELTLNLMFLVDNDIYFHEEKVKIIDPSRKLEIKLQTFRPILKPGVEEEWTLKILGNKQRSADAEMICSMIDASLEKLKPHRWNFFLNDYVRNFISWKTYYGFGTNNGYRFNTKYQPWHFSSQLEKPINFIDDQNFVIRGRSMIKSGVVAEMNPPLMMKEEVLEDQIEIPEFSDDLKVKIRKNFNETTFFYPQLKTDENGNVSIKFTSSEALSRWKFMALAHTKDLRIAQFTKEIITQKELMISPNLPRFLREGDTLYFNTKIISLSDKEIDGIIELSFFDAINMKPIKGILLDEKTQHFSVLAKSSVSKQWKMIIPSNLQALTYRLIASSENHSDGEERTIPVLPQKMLVTESLPIHINPKENKKIIFDRLLHSDQDSTIKHHRLKLEMTSNPAWLVIQSLPYIEQAKRDNAIDLFNVFYANSMASHLLNSAPEIKQIIRQWKTLDKDVLESQLEKNQDLKGVELGETPWQDEADDESEQRRKLSLFFDENNIHYKLNQTFLKLSELQLPDGSWTWYKGMQGSRYITQFMTKGFLVLQSRNFLQSGLKKQVSAAAKKALNFLNKELIKDYSKLKKQGGVNFELDHLSNLQIQQLFILSLNENHNLTTDEFEITKAYYLSQAQKFWPKRSNYLQAMIALTLYRNGDHETANLILKSLKERAQNDEELGMFWNIPHGYYWHQAPIETQALLIEAFDEIGNDQELVKQLKKWLIKQKQTQIWSTPKATVEAVNSILLGDSKLLSDKRAVQVKLGNRPVTIDDVEAGTSYYQKSWKAKDINSQMGEVEVENKNENMVWGALYWQYFSDLDKVNSSKNVLQIEKKLFVKETNENGFTLKAVEDEELKIGDKVVSRIIIKVDRHLEFVHLNDMRASALEPIEVLSGYRYEGGLGFYKSHTDVATNYFFEHLGPGTYVLENEMFVTQTGSFSNGISSIQCLYAPEFKSHSEGIKIEIGH